jgi:hypothetical protein
VAEVSFTPDSFVADIDGTGYTIEAAWENTARLAQKACPEGFEIVNARSIRGPYADYTTTTGDKYRANAVEAWYITVSVTYRRIGAKQ